MTNGQKTEADDDVELICPSLHWHS